VTKAGTGSRVRAAGAPPPYPPPRVGEGREGAGGKMAKTAANAGANGAAARAWQRMLSGRRLDLLDPSPLDIEIEDIAHGLARVARWNGQTHGDHIFSVAQHTLLTEEIARRRTGGTDRRLALALLLHDAPEYVIGDMISPFKVVIGGAYKAVEHRLLDAIHLRFGLPRNLPGDIVAIIKAADRGAAFLEATTLAGFSAAEARRFFGPRPTLPAAVEKDYLTPWPAETAKRRFLQHFNELSAD
jgi:5'-deoxynucleotidase YfbR-like HD superfamily hydrolase